MSTTSSSQHEHILDGVDAFGRCLAPAYYSTDEDDQHLIPPHTPPPNCSSPTHRPHPHPYPPLSDHFDGIPSIAVGDMLQVWHFVTAFAKPLRITPFKLSHFQSALTHNAPSKLLDACLVRLVHLIITDKALVAELHIPTSLVNALHLDSPHSVVDTILLHLPRILMLQSDHLHDPLLHSCLQKLRRSSPKRAFYTTIGPLARCRILRQLVDYANLTNVVRHFLLTSLDQLHEQRRRAREQHTAMRRHYQSELKELRANLAHYNLNYNFNHPPTDQHPVPPSASQPQHNPNRRQPHAKAPMSRRQRERGAKLILNRIQHVRAQLQQLKTARTRRHTHPDHLPLQTDQLAADQPLDSHTTAHPNRTYPLGTDRHNRCYWFLTGSGRIWIEDTERADWSALTTINSIHILLRWLSPHRSDEQLLRKNLRQRLPHIQTELEKERHSIQLAQAQANNENQTNTRTTRAGKRRASQHTRTRKNNNNNNNNNSNNLVVTFLDYENLET